MEQNDIDRLCMTITLHETLSECWQVTPALRWQGRILQQLWLNTNGNTEWRDVPISKEPT